MESEATRDQADGGISHDLRLGKGSYRVVDGKVQNEACEVNVVSHCNLTCRGCSHLSPVMPRTIADPDEVRRDLGILARHYHADHIRLLGGEPLLHPQLLEVIAAARESGVADRTRVVTNGTILWRMGPEFWRLVDEVHLSEYPGQELTADRLDRCRDEATRAGVDLVIKRFDHFREAYSEVGTRDRSLVRRIYETCQIAQVWRCHNVSNGYFYKCPQSASIPRVMTDDPTVSRRDGVELVDDPKLGERLLAYLETLDPLVACSNCLGSVGRLYPHEVVSRDEWRSHQQHATPALLDPIHTYRLRQTPGADNSCVSSTIRLPTPDAGNRSARRR